MSRITFRLKSQFGMLSAKLSEIMLLKSIDRSIFFEQCKKARIT